MTRLHADDEPSKKDWQKQFVKDMKLECRVLYLDEAKSRVVLTAKPSLVRSTERRIFHLSDSLVGVETTGMVLSVLESGGLVIGFFNKVAGLMHASNTRLIQSAEVGLAIKVRVRSVDPSLSQMILEPVNIIRDSSAVSMKNKSTMKEKATAAKPAKPFQIYTAKLVGPWPFGFR